MTPAGGSRSLNQTLLLAVITELHHGGRHQIGLSMSRRRIGRPQVGQGRLPGGQEQAVLGFRFSGSSRPGHRLDQQPEPDPVEQLSFGRTEQAVITDLLEAFRQHVLQEPLPTVNSWTGKVQ